MQHVSPVVPQALPKTPLVLACVGLLQFKQSDRDYAFPIPCI
ncbi:MAG: hypothetical protein ACRC06_05400 [Waterburya sp.]